MNNTLAAKFVGRVIFADGAERFTVNGYGVQRADGAWLSFDGVMPYAPTGGRRSAVIVAETIDATDASLSWIRPV